MNPAYPLYAVHACMQGGAGYSLSFCSVTRVLRLASGKLLPLELPYANTHTLLMLLVKLSFTQWSGQPAYPPFPLIRPVACHTVE